MMSSTVAEMKKSPSTKKAAKSDDMIKGHTVMKKPKGSGKNCCSAVQGFPGVKSPNFREWMASQPGSTRRFIIEAMDADAYRSQDFHMGKARYALTEAAQRDLPTRQRHILSRLILT